MDSWWSDHVFWSVFLDELFLVEEESESRVVTGGEILGEDVFEVLERHALVGVSIVSNHEIVTILWVRRIMLINRSIQISDHLRSLLRVHVSRSVVIILSEDHSGELFGREVIESSLVGGSSESGLSARGNLYVLGWGTSGVVTWSDLSLSDTDWLRVSGGGWLSDGGDWLSDDGALMVLHFDGFSFFIFLSELKIYINHAPYLGLKYQDLPNTQFS